MSVVIVSWNVRDFLSQCLFALTLGGALGDLRAEIIVIDNASRDGSAEAAETFPGVKVVQCPRNLGFGRATNIGLEMSKGAHLLVLNPDTLPRPRSIERMCRFQRECPKAGIISPRLLNTDGSVQSAAFRFPTLTMALLDLFPPPRFVPGRLRQKLLNSSVNGRYPEEQAGKAPFRIDHPLGACMLFSRAAYEDEGGFDPRIFMYAEEIDLALRYRRKGWECWQVPSAEVVHFGGQSTKQMPDQMQIALWKSRLYLYRKHYSRSQRLLVSMLLAISQAGSVLAALLRRATGVAGKSETKRTMRRALKIMSMALKG